MTTSGKHVYDHPRPAVTVDVVVIARETRPRVLLIRRKHEPFAGMWALPGGFIDMEETLEASARRELAEETGIRVDDLEQLHAFGDPGRDPRGRTISVVYLARVDPDAVQPRAADDAAEVAWHPLDEPPRLAFDHAEILAFARQRPLCGSPQGERPASLKKKRLLTVTAFKVLQQCAMLSRVARGDYKLPPPAAKACCLCKSRMLSR